MTVSATAPDPKPPPAADRIHPFSEEIKMSDQLMSTGAAAAYLNVEPQTLAAWRCLGRHGLPYVKVGRAVRYRLADLQEFVARNTVGAAATA